MQTPELCRLDNSGALLRKLHKFKQLRPRFHVQEGDGESETRAISYILVGTCEKMKNLTRNLSAMCAKCSRGVDVFFTRYSPTNSLRLINSLVASPPKRSYLIHLLKLTTITPHSSLGNYKIFMKSLFNETLQIPLNSAACDSDLSKIAGDSTTNNMNDK